MFAAFKMKLPKFESRELDFYYNKGKSIYDLNKKIIKNSLDRYLSPTGSLDASEIEKDWFPSLNADVFLSHSHKDEKNVIALAGYLDSLGVSSFIDSCVWGYANELLKLIDDEYCVQSTNHNGRHTYDYYARNNSTAHVHMILNGALLKMIDRTEFLIFLDTPNSLKTEDIFYGKTNSCWIYSELLMSGLIFRKIPDRIKRAHQTEFVLEHSSLDIDYSIDFSHMTNIVIEDIKQAKNKAKSNGVAILDQLYLSKKNIC